MDEKQIAELLKRAAHVCANKPPRERYEVTKRLLKPTVGRLWYVLTLAVNSWPNDVLDWCDHVLNDEDDSGFFGGKETL